MAADIRELCDESVFSKETRISRDLEEISVSLIDCPKNPYRPICEMALRTWGDRDEKWSRLSPADRFIAVKEVLERRALPLALESAKFTFYVKGVTRHCFDQIARTRIGAVFASEGTKDNFKYQTGFIVPHIFSEEDRKIVENFYNVSKSLYVYLRHKYPGWSARYVLPEGCEHSFVVSMDYSALQQFCSNRMETTEQIDTVAVAWLMKKAVDECFPLLAWYLKPACDWQKKDRAVAVNGFANLLGLPHPSDGRWSSDLSSYKVWNDSPCTDMQYLEAMLEIETAVDLSPIDWISLSDSDRRLFNEDL